MDLASVHAKVGEQCLSRREQTQLSKIRSLAILRRSQCSAALRQNAAVGKRVQTTKQAKGSRRDVYLPGRDFRTSCEGNL